MRRALPLLALAPLVACGGGATAPLGQLEAPVAVAVHQASNRVFIANRNSDELKVFDPTALSGSGSFVLGPAVLFALSIPTVPAPAALGAAGRYVFVLSTSGAEVGFVDLEAEAAFGPRSVDGPDGFPISQALPFLPSSLAAFESRYPGAAGNGDHALVAGLASGTGGALVAVRPPGADGLPSLVARIELAEDSPADIAIDPSGASLALEGAAGPIDDCRAVAIADDRYDDSAHEPGIWLTRVVASPDGALRVEPTDSPGATRLTVRVPLKLLDGTSVVRAAPVRAAAFVPAPLDDAALAAIAVDPCAIRSGRLVAVLANTYCDGADPRSCPDVAMIDLPSGQLATDLGSGPALYDVPGAAVAVQVLAGPFAPAKAFRPVAPDGHGVAITADDPVPTLALVVSSDGGTYFFAPGFGPYLRGPTPADRAAADPTFAIDASEPGPGASALARTDLRRRTPVDAPAIGVTSSRPRDESWTVGYAAPFPGLDDLEPFPALVNLRQGQTADVPASGGANFLSPIAVIADADPARADRLVPLAGTARCQGYPIVAVAADGRSVTVTGVEQTDAVCNDPGLPLGVVPADATPWWVDGSVTGFAGRLPAILTADEPGQIWGGDVQLFTLTPPASLRFDTVVDAAAGATWAFTTTDGFVRYGAFPDTDFQVPADIDAWLRAPPSARGGADWRVFVPYVGGDALIEFDPEAPPPLSTLRAFQ